ncbi:MAG: aminoacyl-tRNA hydrolase [Desulfomonilaceae bacterium]
MKLLNESDSRIFVVVGLGNPGRKYGSHRHNIGFMTVDALADELACTWSPVKHEALTCLAEYGGRKLILVKPQTFMNLSGKAVSKVFLNRNIDYRALIVVHDELDISLGRLRIKVGGGDGGHRGVRSIADSLRFRDFIRIRLGIGRPPSGIAAEDYVLSPFQPCEIPIVKQLIALGVDAIKLIIDKGIENAQHVIHTTKDVAIVDSESV